MTALPDFSAAVLARTLSSLKAEIPASLLETLERLAADNRLLEPGAVVKAITDHVDREPASGN